MPAHLKLGLPAYRQVARAWTLPADRSSLTQTYVVGALRSAAAAVQSRLAARRRSKVSTQGAVFVLGFWRSGTSLLHELLSTDERFTYPTTYACLNSHHFVLTQERALRGSTQTVQRPQDNMVMGWRTPQEDEFALLSRGARSPYEALLAPHALARALRLSDLDTLTEDEAAHWRKSFMEFIRNVALAGGGKSVILKSPAHSYRIATLRRLLPDARFVLVVRNPYEVFELTIRTFAILMNKYGLGPALSESELRTIILAERVSFEAKLQEGLKLLGQHQITHVRFEELIRDPIGVIEKLYTALDLPDFKETRPRLAREVARRSGYSQRATLPNKLWTRLINERWADVFTRYGYPRLPVQPAADDAANTGAAALPLAS